MDNIILHIHNKPLNRLLSKQLAGKYKINRRKKGDATIAISDAMPIRGDFPTIGIAPLSRIEQLQAGCVAAFDLSDPADYSDWQRLLESQIEASFALVARISRMPRPFPSVLTRREKEVCHLLCQGCSDWEIADQLIIGRRTVATHCEHIYRKLKVKGRQQLTAFYG